jgi:hypothetical protein
MRLMKNYFRPLMNARMNADQSFVLNPPLSAAIDSDDFFNTLENAFNYSEALVFSSAGLVVAVSPSRSHCAAPLIDIERCREHLSNPMVHS